MLQFTAAQLAILVEGKVDGDPGATVSGFGKIETAKPGEVTFLGNPKYEDFLYGSGASVVVVNEGFVPKQPVAATFVRVPDAYTAMATLMAKYQQMQTEQTVGIQQPSFISPTAKLGQGVFVAAFVHIGNHATIGDRVKLHPGATVGDNASIGNDTVVHAGVHIYQGCKIGSRVIIHAGAVIGSDGFGFVPQEDGSYKKIPQMGNVIVEDDVEIGANTTIDRATMDSTRICQGVKLDNLIQVAHNVEVGKNTVIAAQTGISGSTKLGSNVLIGGQVAIVGHINIADGVRINGRSGVSKSIITPKIAVTGVPAAPFTHMMRIEALVRSLPELEKRVKELEKKLKEKETGD